MYTLQTRPKKSKKLKVEKRRSETFRLASCYVENASDVEILFISPLTQIFVGCRIGQDITVINPWIFVRKEKILDHVEFYGEDSEFFRIQDIIVKFPRDEIMIGSCNYNANIPVDFYICKTLKAQENIQNMMKVRDQIILQKIMDSVYPKCGSWQSLGSEEQIKNELNLNNRSLLAVDIESDFPIHKGKTYFRITLAEEILDGYIEMGGGRLTERRFLWKRRVDRATQVAPLKVGRSTQTQEHPCQRQNTQYNYESPSEIQITKELSKELDDFFHTIYYKLCDTLIVNYHMNLYQNDYGDLKTCTSPIMIEKPHDTKLYQDIKYRRTRVSCLSWNAIISGVVAAAYSKNPLLCLSKRIHVEEVKDPTTENHIILIWYYNDNVRPKLYLHAKSEVTALSFCPYDENILVAGYSNGLVAVWDLTDRLVNFETPTFLTDREQQYHALIMKETAWIKRTLGEDHIFPVLTSGYQIGHSSPVTSIVWIPPTHFISDMRVYEECEDGETHMQFFTISLDGNKILVWDLKPEEQYGFTHKKTSMKSSRLATIPEMLTQNISPLHYLQEHFKPVCKLFVSTPKPQNSNTNNNPLMQMVMRNELYHYTAINPDTLNDLDAATYFNVNNLAFDFDASQKIIITTGLGSIQIAFWKGANYKGEGRDEVCKIDTFEVVHDGPILVCEINTFFPDMLLTVGGSVFAIWDCSKTKNALIWRKSSHRYQSGMWCLYHPLSILVIRIDRCYELWNVSERSDHPIERYKYKGYDLIKFYGDSGKNHARKQTFITTDALGAFKVFTLPSDVVSKSNEDVVKSMEYIARIHERKRYIEALKEKCRRRMEMNEAQEPNSTLQEPVLDQSPAIGIPEEVTIARPIKISNKVKFEQNLERYMTTIEITRKRLNTAQIKRDSLKCLQAQANKKLCCKGKLLNSEEILAKAQEKILENNAATRKVRRRIEVTISKEKAYHLKKMCIESFREIEHEIVNIINSKKYSFHTRFHDHCRNMRRKYEDLAHFQMRHLKRKVVVETEDDVIHVKRVSWSK